MLSRPANAALMGTSGAADPRRHRWLWRLVPARAVYAGGRSPAFSALVRGGPRVCRRDRPRRLPARAGGVAGERTALMATVARRGLFGRVWQPCGDTTPDLSWFSTQDALDADDCLRLDLRRRPGLRVIAIELPSQTRMYHVFHHACCDGLGALAWLGRLYAAYARTTCPDVPVEATHVDVGTFRDFRLTEDLSTRLGSHAQARTATWRRIREELLTRPARLLPTDRTGRRPAGAARISFPGSVTHAFDSVQTRSLKRRAQKSCATLNDLLLSAMFRALRDWNAELKPDADRDWYRIMAPVDLRGPQHDRLPAANLVSCVFVTQPGALCSDPRRLLNAVTQRMQYAVGSRSALIMYNLIRRLAPRPRTPAAGAESVAGSGDRSGQLCGGRRTRNAGRLPPAARTVSDRQP